MRMIEAEDVHRVLAFPPLIAALRRAFGRPAGVPQRSVFRLDGAASSDAFAVLPAWNDELIGVKAFTYLPGNAAHGRPILHSRIMLFDRATGAPLDVVDGTSVTWWRTAAVSALAADYLARPGARRLLVCGTGNLAPYMARAHAAVRPITRIDVWGRTPDRADAVVADLRVRLPDLDIRATNDVEGAAHEADVISCATGAHEPIIHGRWVRPGTHVDLVGNHERDGRECDTDLVVRSRLFVDSRVNVLNEAGEVLIPIAEGRLTEADVLAELSELCSGTAGGREAPGDITLFKSVGTALSDLAAAQLVVTRQ